MGQGVQEVLDGLVAGGRTHLLLELGNDGGLVGIGESRGAQDGGELSILLDEASEGREGLGGGLERRGLHGGSVLLMAHALVLHQSTFSIHPLNCCKAPDANLQPIGPMRVPRIGSSAQMDFGENGWSYQSSGIGAIETVHSYRRSDFLGSSSGVAARRNSGKRPLGSCSSDGAECLSGEHGDVTGEVAVGRD